MNPVFFGCWVALLVYAGALMWVLDWAAKTPPYHHYRLRTPTHTLIPPGRKVLNTQLNNVLSLLIFGFYFTYFGADSLYDGWPRVTQGIGEVLGVLLLYDFLYYCLHRALHHPKLMRWVHGVHHFVRFPTASESLYVHPAENIGGLGLLILSMVLLGPISAASFLFIFALHATINIVVHCNLKIPHPAFRLFNFWVEKHDIHHHRVKYNYASIFPFWDQAFGTAR